MSKNYMKFILSLLCLLLLNMSLYAESNENIPVNKNQILQKKVTINVRNKTLDNILSLISKQTNLEYGYSSKDGVNKSELFSLNVSGVSAKEALDKLFEGSGYTYEISDNKILVIAKKVVKLQPTGRVNVKGRVVDENGKSVAGATVIIAGTSTGAISGEDGSFTLFMNAGGSLSISYVGYNEMNIVVNDHKHDLTVKMEPNAVSMDDVVVNGYQTLRKNSVAGSYKTIKGEELQNNGTQTLEQMLQGKVAGMNIVNRSGLTGTRQRTRVRGTSTILGNAEPVWVVDGMIQEDPLPFKTNDLANISPDNMDMIRDFVGGAIAWLNPNDIETVTVLKDAASTAIYGVRAANGVIVITTKKGQRGRLSVSYDGNVAYTPRLSYNRMELMNSQQRVDVSREAYEKGIPLDGVFDFGYTALASAFRKGDITLDEFSREAKILETNNTDWFDILFRDAFSHNHNVGISGGSDKATYRTSVGVSQNNNTAKGNDQSRYNASANVSMELWNRVTLNTSLNASIDKTKAFLGKDPYGYASTANRAISAYNADGTPFYYKDESNKFLYNVQNEIANSGNNNTTGTINANISLRWEIIEGLTFNTAFGYSYTNMTGESWYTEQSNYIASIRRYDYGLYEEGSREYLDSFLPMGGELNQITNNSYTWNWRNQLEYSKVFNNVHSVTAMVGQESRSTLKTGNNRRTYGYLPDKGKLVVHLPFTSSVGAKNDLLKEIPTILDTKANYMSYYIAASYMFDNRYAVNSSVRMDASNRFGQDKSARYQPVWAVGLRWNVGYEPWLQNQRVISDMSLRFSYGYQGNVVESVSPELVATIEATDLGYDLKLKDIPAPELRWEKVNSVNIGVDWSLFNNKISGSFEWYTKKTKDMVMTIDVPFENGVRTRPVNGGSMSNSGWDLSAYFTPLRTKNWILSLGATIGQVHNKLVSTIQSNGDWRNVTTGNHYKEGYAASSFWAFKYMGLDPQTGGPLFDMSGFENSEYKTDATMYMDYVGKMDPDFTTGINISLRYKNLVFSTSLYLSLGNQIFLAPPGEGVIKSIPSEYKNMSTEWVNRWRKPGDEKFTNVPALPNLANNANPIKIENSEAYTYWPYEMYAYSTERVVDAWYLKCGSMNLSYTLPSHLLPKSIKNLGFNFSISNPFSIHSKDFKGRDPEVALGSQPLSRTITFGASISF